MLSKILFPTDFSEHSVKVKKELKKIAGCSNQLILLNVLDNRLFPYINSIDNISKIAKANLNKWKSEFEKAGFKKVTTIFIEGVPFNVILETAEKKKVTSIFLGHQGANAVERMLLGSTAEKVARKASVPVILIK
jgi:nucleotide-binding universal stress UspA family protein